MNEPKIRFPQYTKEWKKCSLSDIFEERNEKSVITEEYPLLSFTIEQGIIRPEDKKTNKRDFLIKDKENKKFLITKYNDIIYNPANIKYGAIHRNKLGQGCVSPIYAIFTTTENPNFMESVVRNPKFIKKSLQYLEGTVVKLMTLKPKDFLKMEVSIPEKSEQEDISNFLSEIDNLIKISEKEIENLKLQKVAVARKIFKQDIKFKKEDGKDYKIWSTNPIENYFEYSNGKGYENEIDENGKYFLISLNSLDANGNLKSEFKTVSSADWYLKKDDIVMVLSDVGHGDFLGLSDIIPEDDKYVLNQRMALLRNINPEINVKFARLYINYSQSYFKLKGQGSSQKNLSKPDVMKFPIVCPEIEEQNRIVDLLYSFEDIIKVAEEELNCLKLLKQGLVQQMFI